MDPPSQGGTATISDPTGGEVTPPQRPRGEAINPVLENRTARDTVELARAARDRGHAALAGGDATEAARWLDRALRLAPRDPNIALSLASVMLGRDPGRSAALFDRVAAHGGPSEAWRGLAACHLLRGEADQAARALAGALSSAVVAAGTDALADAIVGRANSPGWCGIDLADGGRLIIRPRQPIRPHLLLDGQRLAWDPVTPVAGPRSGCSIDPVGHRSDDPACANGIPGGTALPAGWETARTLEVMTGEGRHLLGSPINLLRLRRIAGHVEAEAGGLRGWAWYPANPDALPRLLVQPAAGGAGFGITASDTSIVVDDAGPLARPRGFTVSAAQLSAHPGAWHVRTADGQDLLGSPLDPWAFRDASGAIARTLARLYPAAPRRTDATRSRHGARQQPAPDPGFSHAPLPIGPPPPRPPDLLNQRPVDVVIPVHDNAAVTLACLDSVLPSLPADSTAIVVDDASTDPALRAALDRLAAARRIRLIRNARNRGFPASANAGMVAAAANDVVLLNSDTLVPRDWLGRLRQAAYAVPGIGTATPLSNEATILSYPAPGGGNLAPDQRQTERLAVLAWRTHGARSVEIPVGVGFCLYIRRDCLDAVGLLRADVFAQGYGEENDFCLRARALGWRNVAAPGVFVTHRGGGSFGGAGRHLLRRNQGLLNHLHPGYDALIAAFAGDDPLAEARRDLDLARWRAARPRSARGRPETVLLITHADGGGVEQRVRHACNAHLAAGRRPIVLRPARDEAGRRLATLGRAPPPDDRTGRSGPADPVPTVAPGVADRRASAAADPAFADHFPNLRFRLPDELPALLRLLRAEPVATVEVHHVLDHHPVIHELPAMLGTPHEVHVHDYAWFCPRVALVDADRRLCDEPPPAGCETCVARGGRFIADDIPVAALIARSARFLATARRVHAPSRDAARRMARHFPGLRPIVTPHEADPAPPSHPHPREHRTRARICVAGAIGLHKGYDVLLACARDAARRDLGIEFVVVGTTTDDATLLATDRVFITGRYEPEEAVSLIRAQQPRLGLLPSIWPETWCLTLTELWRAGLDVVAFDVGAQAERIAKRGRGWVVPLGLPAEEINNVLVAAICRHRDTNVR